MEHTRVLVVEDEAIVAKDIQNRLRNMGYEVPAVVHTGKDAINKTEEIVPDLVLMDIQLIGDMDGVEAAGVIRDRCDVPVIYLTAYSDRTTLDKAKVTTPMGYLIKPFEDRELSTTIEMALYRYQMEKALKESEAKLRTIFEQAKDEIVYLNVHGIVIDVNKGVEDIFGYRPEEVLGKNMLEIPFVNPDKMQEIATEMEQAINGNVAILKTLEAQRKDGNPVFVEVSAGLIQEGDSASGIIAIIRDVTERVIAEKNLSELNVTLEQKIAEHRVTEQELRDSEEKYASIVEQSQDSILIIQDDHLEFVNRAHMELTGYTDQELLNMPLLELVTSSFQQQATQRLEARATGRIVNQETRTQIRCKDGTVRDMDVYTARIQLRGRSAYMVTMHDITEKKRAEREAARAEGLEELNRLKDAFVASVSHELRTPLTAIKGYSNTLNQPDIEWGKDEQMDFLREIENASDRLTHIVDDLIDISQIESKTMKLEKLRIEAPDILSSIQNQINIIAANHHLEIVLSDDLPPVYCDEMRIGQVITNLVSNAVAYSDSGTKITLAAERVDGKVIVSVTDEGIGIPQDSLERVFDRFHRLESGITRRKGGSGLGLSICSGIIEQHGETIWVDSEEGNGSRFSFYLTPVEDAEYLDDIEAFREYRSKCVSPRKN